MKPIEILRAAEAQSELISLNLSLIIGETLGVDEKEARRKNLATDIKRLDALITLIETDC
jgi:hypothetical protein